MAVPQLVLDAIRFLLALAAPASLVALVLAGIALRREGTTSFSVGGGGFSKWMFWAIVMITLPQVFGWFAFWGVGAPLPGGGIGNGWMSTFSNDATIFVNTLVVGRLVPVLAAWMVLRSVIDWSEGYTPSLRLSVRCSFSQYRRRRRFSRGGTMERDLARRPCLKPPGHTRQVE